MIQLTEPEFEKLSEVTGVGVVDLENLYNLQVFKENALLRIIIKRDYLILRRQDRYTPQQIYHALARKYRVGENFIRVAANERQSRRCYCERCQKIIRKCEYERNGGLCDYCVSDEIHI